MSSVSPHITVRRAEPADYEAVHRIFSAPKAVWGTLQLPFPSAETWRKRLAEPGEGLFSLVACAENEVVGQLGLQMHPNSPRRKHAAALGMAVRDDWQGKGVGSALMQAAVDLADKWLNLARLELEVIPTTRRPSICTRSSALSSKAHIRCLPFATGATWMCMRWQD